MATPSSTPVTEKELLTVVTGRTRRLLTRAPRHRDSLPASAQLSESRSRAGGAREGALALAS